MNGPRRVYSSGPDGNRSGRESGLDGRPAAPARDLAPERHDLRVRLERSGRMGKQVTVAGPLSLSLESARELLAVLKRRCGSGGTLKPLDAAAGQPGFELELQGDHRDRLSSVLTERGFPVKRSGG